MDISIIIVEYLNVELVKRAIASLKEHITNLPYEIIIVSNSCYSTYEQRNLEMIFSDAKIILNPKNIGFAAGSNCGMKIAKGKYVLLLNPDARLMDNSIHDAITFMEKNDNIAVLGPKVVDNEGRLQDSCRVFMTPWHFLERQFRRLLRNKDNLPVLELKNTETCCKVDWVSALCMLVKKNAIDKVGLMDERYFMYVEDMDWCREFWCAQYEVWYFPGWAVYHDGARTSSGNLHITNKLMWIHLVSWFKYLLKWRKKRIPPSP